MRCAIENGEIVLTQVGDNYSALTSCGYKWDRKTKSHRAQISVEALDGLERVVGDSFPDRLRELRSRVQKRDDALNKQRDMSGEVKQLVAYPIKNATLMRHQVAGANSAMIIFGAAEY